MFIVGVFFLSQAEDLGREGPWPWQHLSKTIPAWGNEQEHHFFLGIGAFLLVFALESYPALQKPLTWNFSQYLGELSFGIYTMHELLIWTLYDHVLTPWQETHLGDSLWALAPGMIIIFLVVLWAADLFTRIDDKVVGLGRYVQSVTFIK
jgi:peptidoglycan/LPS O-acetylase OafA/YrhL